MGFNLQPLHLKGTLIQLVPLEEVHFEKLFMVASDPLIWEQHPNKKRYQKAVFRTYFDGALLSKGAFIIIDIKTNAIVGSSRFYEYDENNNSIKIGYTFIGRNFWGKNYNIELKQLMINYAFENLTTIIFEIGANNIRSQKAIDKIGAQKIGEHEVQYFGEELKLNFIYQLNK
jgi:N-acetyltransferase